MRVLVLEDDLLIAAEIASLLTLCGHVVEACTSNAGDAVQIAFSTRPALLIADIDLGAGGDGCDAAIEVYERTGLKTVFVTGRSDAGSRDRTQRAWPLGFLTKPFKPEVFCQIIRAAVSLMEHRARTPHLAMATAARLTGQRYDGTAVSFVEEPTSISSDTCAEPNVSENDATCLGTLEAPASRRGHRSGTNPQLPN